MKRSQETAEKLERISKMRDFDPAIMLASASIQDPEGALLADSIGKMLHDYIVEKRMGAAVVTMTVAAVAYALGLRINTTQEGAGEALDHTVDMMEVVMRFSAARGFAEARESDNGNRDAGAPANE